MGIFSSLAKKCDKKSTNMLDVADLSNICAKHLLNSAGAVSLGIYACTDFDDNSDSPLGFLATF